jgi:hypothetical protein
LKCRIVWFFICFSSLGLVYAKSAVGVHDSVHDSGSKAEDPQRAEPGKPPMTMAPRLESLEGKTIYIVDVGYPDTRPFIEEIRKVFKQKYPKTKWIIKMKTGSYFDNDPELWREIKENGHGMIMAVGH